MKRPIVLFLNPLLLAFLAGCSPYVSDYHYLPHPALVEIPPSSPQQPPPVAALASIVGVHKDDPKLNIPLSVEVRLRIDNNGPDPVTFNPGSLQLSTGDLVRFPTPMINPAQPVTLPAMQSVMVGAFFPFPNGRTYDDTAIGSLHLHWAIQINGHSVPQDADFQRIHWAYYDPYWDYWGGWGYGPYPYAYPYPVFGGVVIVHGGRR